MVVPARVPLLRPDLEQSKDERGWQGENRRERGSNWLDAGKKDGSGTMRAAVRLKRPTPRASKVAAKTAPRNG